jgi:hypothetical protein
MGKPLLLLLAGAILALASPALAQETEAHKAVVRHFFAEVVEAGNVDVIDQTHHPEFRFQGVGNTGGIAEHKAWNAGLHDRLGDIDTTLDAMVAEGDLVVGRFRLEATYLGGIEGAPESALGTRVGWGGFFQFRFKDGLIVENVWLRDEPAYERSLGIGGAGKG